MRRLGSTIAQMDLDHDTCYRAICLRDARFDGRFFTAVKTTGIYCRPICPAPTPRSKNVLFYPTAAAAQARRVLLAKQLIHETRLPMAEIAFAAGFGSVRRFNETFLALFGRPPSALRGKSKADVSAGPRGEIELLLRYQPPYDWRAT